MSKSSFILALVLVVGLGTVGAQETREKRDAARPAEKTSASPPASRAPAAAPIPVPGSVVSPARQRGSTDSKLRNYAESLLRQYDKNKNGMLEKDEWSEMKASWHEADRNRDGTITLDELASRMAQFMPRGETRAASPSDSSVPPPVRALPPVSREGPSRPGGEMPQSVRPYASPGSMFSRPVSFGTPDRPIDPRAPLVSIQLVMVEVVADAAEKAGPKPPASSDLAKAPAVLPLDLSAPSEKLLEELRKLGLRGRLDVLYQIQLTTADQQSALFQLGQRQPRVVGVMANQFGQSNSIDYLNTGLIVQVQPQVTGGVVSTKLAIEESRVGRAEDGIPIIVPAKGESVRAAPVHSRTLQTAVNVPSGQTIVLSGMTENDGPRKRQLAVLLCPRIIPANSGESARPKQ